MFDLDEKFLQDVGIANLPDDQKQQFVQQILEELEFRVGNQLAEGLSDEQMQEFDGILRQDEEKVRRWLEANVPNYRELDDFKKFLELVDRTPDTLEAAGLSEYTSTKWLEKNRPDYREVVTATLDNLKQEIIQNRDAILSS